MSNSHVFERVVAVWVVLVFAFATGPGCGADSPPPTADQMRMAEIHAELEALVESGLEAELPPPMSREQRELTELMHHRRQVADDMKREVEAVMAPVAVAASFFAIDGTADLMLAVVPVDELGKAVGVARRAFKLRKDRRRVHELIKLHRKFEALLPGHAQEFMQIANRLKSAERKALKIIYKRTNSPVLIQSLMRKHVDGTADVSWIADKIASGKFDRTFARRYTFDRDIVEELENYDAHIPWHTLQAMVERKPVTQEARTSLTGKVAGLMGERAARQYLGTPAFIRKYVGKGDRITSVRGARYRRGMRAGEQGSLDIVAYTLNDRAVFVEVKNWSAESWNNTWRGVVAQLARHNRGIEEALETGARSRTLAARVLMVNRKGFEEWTDEDKLQKLKEGLQKLGWHLEYIPQGTIRSVGELIDDLR